MLVTFNAVLPFACVEKEAQKFHGKKTQWINDLVTFLAFTLEGDFFSILLLPCAVLPFRLILQQYSAQPNAVRLPHFHLALIHPF